MPQQESRCFAMPLKEMLEQSAPRMLAWATRWKIGIYQSIHQIKLLSKEIAVPIWKIWEPYQTNEPKKKVDKRKSKESWIKKYKATRITTKMKVTKWWKSTCQVPDYIKRKHIYKLLLMILEQLCF